MKRILLIALGTVLVGLGVVGIFMPLLPTTPFLLLAAYCYARSSRRFYDWLMNAKYLGDYIRNYRERRGMTLGAKVVSLGSLWVAIGYSALFAGELLLVRILLVGIALGVTTHLLRLPTCRGKG
jgi:uncharacterized membrane protein YbaN (DUF454 family)